MFVMDVFIRGDNPTEELVKASYCGSLTAMLVMVLANFSAKEMKFVAN